MKTPFTAPPRAYDGGERETRYRRARQEWDMRMGAAVMAARRSAKLVAALVLLCVALAAGLVAVALQQRTFVHVVETSADGEVLSVRVADRDWSPTQAQIVHHLGRFIHLIRSLPTDRVVLAANWRDAYRFLTPQAAARMSEIARAEATGEAVGRIGRTVEVRSVLRRADGAWEVNWAEHTASASGVQASERYVGHFSVAIRAPRTADEVAANPLGLMISDFSWSRIR